MYRGLCRVLISAVRALGMRPVTVSHVADNVAADQLCEALGFEIAGVTFVFPMPLAL